MEQSSYLSDYFMQANERARLGAEALPLNAAQMQELAQLLQDPPAGSDKILLQLLTNRVPAGVDEAAQVKAGFLRKLLADEVSSPLISKEHRCALLQDCLLSIPISDSEI